jgi:hypothetical protein
MSCIKCNVEITEENKVSGRNSCKDCERKRRREYTQKKVKELKDKICELCKNKKIEDYCENCKNLYSKKCSKCQENKLMNNYVSSRHNVCKSCNPVKKNTSKDEWLKINKHIKEKQCIDCKETKDINDFVYHTNNFRNQCKKCILSKKYYETYRNKKREENEEDYLKHNSKMHREWAEKNKEHYEKYYKEYNSTLKRHINNAILKAKNKQEITKENRGELYDLFNNLMVADCVYCGNNKSNIGKYNGADRVDSSKCYSQENCKSCCITCNMIKNTMDIGSFLKKCAEISIHNNLNIINSDDYRIKFHKDMSLPDTTSSYNLYKHKAKDRNINFNITEREYLNIIKNNCYLCGKTNSKKIIGIDRVDNNIGYELDNCKSCCKYCNYMKNKTDLNDFLTHIQKIIKYTENNIEFKNNIYTFSGILQKTKHNFKK